jgi:guanylate kinase
VIQGKLLIITAPSGAGKTTIVRHLLNHVPGLAFSVSATTRLQRENETDGVDYFFMDTTVFLEKVEAEAFIEWEEVYPGKYYGTLKSEMERQWLVGNCIIFDIDVLGALNLKSQFPDDALALFIAPPSLEVLEDRLRQRGTETKETIQVRLERAKMEMGHSSQFDKVVINDNLELACKEAQRIVEEFLC